MEQYRKSPRAGFIDYDGGDFFVTICTRNMDHYFGEILDGEMILSDIGTFTSLQLTKASVFNPAIEVPLFVVMPNHVHAIVCVKSGGKSLDSGNTSEYRSPNPSLRLIATSQRHVPLLSRYISSFKGAVTKFANMRHLDFGWQSRYHDHCIRGNNDGNLIAEYIKNNVSKWEEDCFYSDDITLI